MSDPIQLRAHKEIQKNSSSQFGKTVWLSLCLVALVVGTSLHAATYQVGANRAYKGVGALPGLVPGDIVEVDPGTYKEVKRWTTSGTAAQPITIRGVGTNRPVFDATGLNVDGALPHPRAVFQMEGSYILVDNLEFRYATNGDNGAGIRITGGNNVTVRNCRITSCDMGVMSDNNSNLVIETSEIASNGAALYDGYSHNFYLGGNNATIRFCYIHDSLHGQNFKTRAHYTELLYNYISDSQDGEVGLVDSAATAATNSHAVMIGNVVISKPRLSGYNSGRFVQFGQDSGGQHYGTLFAFNNTFIAGDTRIQFLSANATGARISAKNNIFYGSDKIVPSTGDGTDGLNNWTSTTAVVPTGFLNTLRGSDPVFINRVARKLRLAPASACRDQGSAVLAYLDGNGVSNSGVPISEYINHQKSAARASDGFIDLGAYEFVLPRIVGVRSDNVSRWIDVASMPDYQYVLVRATNLNAASWTSVSPITPGTNGVLSIPFTNTAAQNFYRVQASY